MTFAINEDSFEDNDEKETYLEYMRRTIIENGGVVVESSNKANYLI